MCGVRVKGRTVLRAAIDNAWEALHTPEVFRSVSSPFTVFRTAPSKELPERFHPETDYEVTVWAMGLVPLGRQIIRLEDNGSSWEHRVVTDVGHGVTGPLSLLKNWRHEMVLTARADGTTDFSDTLTAKAGLLTPLAWLGLQVFWLWRVTKLRALAGDWDSPNTARWNARYAGATAMWSGKVNPVVEQVAGALTPGKAFDLGAGEGGDALWLASKGWDTTAVDASSVGIFRGRREELARQTAGDDKPIIRWLVADLTRGWPLGKEQAELVTLMFLHADPETRQTVWSRAVDAVAPGGTLLIVGHDPDDAKLGIPRPPEEMCFRTDELEALVPSDWSSVKAEVITRTQTVNGVDVAVGDVVLVATR